MSHEMALFAEEELKRYDKRTSNDIPTKWKYAAKEMGCGACPLNRNVGKLKPRRVQDGETKVYVIGRAPTAQEQESEVQFSSEWGTKIADAFARHNLDVMYDTAVRCKPTQYTGAPNQMELECCRGYIDKSMEEFEPDAVVVLGKENLTKMFGAIGGPKVWRGRRMPLKVGERVVYCYPLFHPTDMKSDYFQDMFFMDVERACKAIIHDGDSTLPVVEAEPDDLAVKTLLDVEDIERLLISMENEPVVAFDIETANLKSENKERSLRPFAPGSTLLSIALCWDSIHAYTFPLQHPNVHEDYARDVMELLYQWFKHSKTKKIAHNLAYELEWLSKWCDYNFCTQGGPWEDTMAQAFVLDSRPGGLSLDSRTLQNYGFRLKELNKHLDMENLEHEDLDTVLKYNALDAFWTFQLWHTQNEKIAQARLGDVYQEQVDRIAPMVEMQMKGIHVDQERLKEVSAGFEAEIQASVDYFKEKDVNPESPKAMLAYLSGTVSDKIVSTGEKALRPFAKHPDVAQLLAFRKYNKLLSTYTGPLSSCVWEDGMVHTNYRTMRMVTRRVSSDQPNMQNIPKHGGEESKQLRSVFIAPEGFKMVSVDYGQIEARVLAMASGDEFFHKALKEHYDIHQEWAQRLKEAFPQFKDLDDKAFRQTTKNFFVFPNFYGAGSKNIAENMGIRNVAKVTDVRKEFWEKFAGVRTWQNKMISFYKQNGYVKSLSGYIRRGPLSYTEVINTPIQSSASDIVVRSQSNLVNLAHETGDTDLIPIMNIHDDLTFYVAEDKLELTIKTIVDTMLRPGLEWVTTPLVAEASVGDRWDQMEDYGTYEA